MAANLVDSASRALSLCRKIDVRYVKAYNDAEPLYQQALAILKKARGPEHTNVATAETRLIFRLAAKPGAF